MSTKETWSQADEAAYSEMAARRDRVLSERRLGVEAVAMTFDGDGPTMGLIADWLIHNADAVRDALKPYDSGVRVADALETEWIKWDGGEMPVPFGAKISVRHRDGGVYVECAGDSHSNAWNHYGFPGDIVAYKVRS